MKTDCVPSRFSQVWLCDHIDCSPPGSSVHEIPQAKNTGVGCHSLLQGSPQLRDWTQVSCIAGRFFTIWAFKEVIIFQNPEKTCLKLENRLHVFRFECILDTRYFSSDQFSSVVSDSLQPHELQHAKPPCPSPTPGVYPNSCVSSWWCHSAISSSVIPFLSCPQSLPASESFPMSQVFTWGAQSIGVSALALVLPKNTQD